jgi:hypothetical protein
MSKNQYSREVTTFQPPLGSSVKSTEFLKTTKEHKIPGTFFSTKKKQKLLKTKKWKTDWQSEKQEKMKKE